MRGCQPLPAYGRAIIAVIALYALCLQALLGAATPQSSIQSAGVICPAHDGAGAPDDGAPCPQHACCPAVQIVGSAAPAPANSAAIRWLPAPAASVRWAALAAPRARAPPDRSVGARGPPAA